jgi:hypothetical protein
MNRFRKLLAGLLVGGAFAPAGALADRVRVARAHASFVVQRPREFLDGEPAYRNAAGELVAGRRWVVDESTGAEIPDPRDVVTLSTDEAYNVKTTVGIDFTFDQTYSTTPGANGLNYIALSNDTVSETSASTTLSNEIAANGLSRAIGTYVHTPGAATATIAKTFTCSTASQAAQKAALFSASSSGTMHHVLAFTQRTLQVGDTLSVTFTISIS